MGTVIKDIVCGMDTSTDSKFHTKIEDELYYFCSDNCKNKFNKNPQEYLHVHDDKNCASCKPLFKEHTHVHERKKEKAVDNDAIYTCPMHPEIQQKGPGACPKCGMALEPTIVQAGEEDTEELDDMTRRFKVSTGCFTCFYFSNDRRPNALMVTAVALHVNGTVDRVCSSNTGSTLGRMAIFS